MKRVAVPLFALLLAVSWPLAAQELAPGDEPEGPTGFETLEPAVVGPTEIVETEPAPSGRGIASWYGPGFQGRRTASGERFDMHALTAAHPSLPFGTVVRVENADDGRSIDVRINDRGPHIKQRVIDLSRAAARSLGLLDAGGGLKEVILRVIKPKTQ